MQRLSTQIDQLRELRQEHPSEATRFIWVSHYELSVLNLEANRELD